MRRSAVLPVAAFVVTVVAFTVGGTAYLHAGFATKIEVKEIKVDLKTDLMRIEKKIDKLIDRELSGNKK